MQNRKNYFILLSYSIIPSNVLRDSFTDRSLPVKKYKSFLKVMYEECTRDKISLTCSCGPL